MFDDMKMAGALMGLMKNKEKLREAGERIRAKLLTIRAEGQAGSGAVRAYCNGKMEVLDVELDPALASTMGGDSERGLAQSLITEAVNDAMANARKMAQEEVRREAESLGLSDLPGLDKLLGGGGIV